MPFIIIYPYIFIIIYPYLRYIAMLYTYSIGNQPWNTMVVFKMRDSVPSARYSSVCNVLRQRKICYDNNNNNNNNNICFPVTTRVEEMKDKV